MKIFKSKVYRVTYSETRGVDHFSGRYILENDWLCKMIKDGVAVAVKV